jgi:hypothetical protein
MVPDRNTANAHSLTSQVLVTIIHQQASCQALADPLSLVDTIRNNADLVHDRCFLVSIGWCALNILPERAGLIVWTG